MAIAPARSRSLQSPERSAANPTPALWAESRSYGVSPSIRASFAETPRSSRAARIGSGAGFDRMFLQMMIRHHQGAIEMATKAQQQGQHPEAKKLAEKIAADQAAEVKEMQDLLTKV